MEEWLVKVKHYGGGGESVVHRTNLKQQAMDLADSYNSQYHTDNYYIEKYDPEKVKGFGGPDPILLREVLDKMWGQR